jgi:hypothetical protein
MKNSLISKLLDKWGIHWWEYYIRFKYTFNLPTKLGEKYKIPYLYRVCKLTGKRQEVCIWRAEKMEGGKITTWKDVK